VPEVLKEKAGGEMKSRTNNQIIKLLLAASMAIAALNGPFVQAARASQISTPSQTPNLDSQKTKNPAIVQENENGLVIKLRTDAYNIQTSIAEGQSCQTISVADYAQTSQPGWPGLPFIGTVAGIPAQGEPSLTILEAEPTLLDGQFNLCPAPSPIINIDPQGEIHYQGEAVTRNAQAYSSQSFMPATAAELSSTGFLRSQRVAQIRFNPFQYNPASGQERYFKTIRIQLNYANPDRLKTAARVSIAEGAFEPIIQDILINYQSAVPWRVKNDPDAAASFSKQTSELAPTAGQETYKLQVNTSGMYRVTYEDLQAAGADLSGIDPHSFRMFNQGQEVAIRVSGEEDSIFGPGEMIKFFTSKVDTKYTGTNVYWLTWGGANGLRMATLSGTPAGASVPASFLTTQHIEQNNLYLSSSPDSNGDDWYWDIINASSASASNNYSITLSHVDIAATGTARLRGLIKGYSATPRHHTRLYINNNLVAENYWSSIGEYSFDVEFPMQYLVEGSNTIKVESPRDNGITSDIDLSNWFEIDYWKTFVAELDSLLFNGKASGSWLYQVQNFSQPSVELYDVTDPNTPALVTGYTVQPGTNGYTLSFQVANATSHRYLAGLPNTYASPANIAKYNPADLMSAANGADYLLITHSAFYTDVLPLATQRSNQGLRVKVIDVQSIYDEFNYGIFDPKAIHDFLAYAYQNWQSPAPQYVLLVGDGNYDPRNYKGTNEPVFIPPYLLPVDPWITETASDNRFVTVNGDDNLPDMLVGRLPVKTRAEAAAIVNKILAYEQTPANVDWNGNVLFVADNPDSAGDFYSYSDLVANNNLPAGYTPQKIYYGSTHTSIDSAKTAILNEINAGKLIVNYVGHGAMMRWASENLFNNTSIPSLTNSGKLPFFVSMACMTSYFFYPSPAGYDYSSINEALVKAANGGGAIASWGSAGMGLASGQDYLNRGLYQAIFSNGQTRIGAAAVQAKLFLYAQSTSYPDLIDTYTLFGDPALKLNVRPADLSVQLNAQPSEAIFSGQPITYTLTYNNAGSALATHVRIEMPLAEAVSNITVNSSGAAINQVQTDPLAWETADLAPGQGGVITIQGTVTVDLTGEISSQASISSAIADSNLNNNDAGPLYTVAINPDDLITDVSTRQLSGAVEISWQATTEVAAVGYNVYRSDSQTGERILLNAVPIPTQAAGHLVSIGHSYLDTSVTLGKTYFYWVEMVDQNGVIVEEETSLSTFNFMFLPTVMLKTF
jgi:hypothetical protein